MIYQAIYTEVGISPYPSFLHKYIPLKTFQVFIWQISWWLQICWYHLNRGSLRPNLAKSKGRRYNEESYHSNWIRKRTGQRNFITILLIKEIFDKIYQCPPIFFLLFLYSCFLSVKKHVYFTCWIPYSTFMNVQNKTHIVIFFSKYFTSNAYARGTLLQQSNNDLIILGGWWTP